MTSIKYISVSGQYWFCSKEWTKYFKSERGNTSTNHLSRTLPVMNILTTTGSN